MLSQARDMEGEMGWMAAFSGELVAETEADAYIARAMDRDPDLWVVELDVAQAERFAAETLLFD